MALVLTNVSEDEVKEMRKILAILDNSPSDFNRDIAVEIAGKRYQFTHQDGNFVVAFVER